MQCSTVQCNVVQCSAVQCSIVLYSAMLWCTVQCSATQCSAEQYSALQFSRVQCNSVFGMSHLPFPPRFWGQPTKTQERSLIYRGIKDKYSAASNKFTQIIKPGRLHHPGLFFPGVRRSGFINFSGIQTPAATKWSEPADISYTTDQSARTIWKFQQLSFRAFKKICLQ